MRKESVSKPRSSERCSFKLGFKRKRRSSCRKRNARKRKKCYLLRNTTKTCKREWTICATLSGLA